MNLIRGYSDRATLQYSRQDLLGWEGWAELGYVHLGSLISLFADEDGVEELACRGYCHFVAIQYDYYCPGILSSVRASNRAAVLDAVQALGPSNKPWTSLNEFTTQRIGLAFQSSEDALKFALLLPDEAR